MLWEILLLAGLLLFALFGLHKMIDDDRADLTFPAETFPAEEDEE